MFDYLFTVITEDGDLYGEEFFVECDTFEDACGIAMDNFPDEELRYLGKFSPEEAEMMGLDTY